MKENNKKRRPIIERGLGKRPMKDAYLRYQGNERTYVFSYPSSFFFFLSALPDNPFKYIENKSLMKFSLRKAAYQAFPAKKTQALHNSVHKTCLSSSPGEHGIFCSAFTRRPYLLGGS